jgi:hypothetical protein
MYKHISNSISRVIIQVYNEISSNKYKWLIIMDSLTSDKLGFPNLFSATSRTCRRCEYLIYYKTRACLGILDQKDLVSLITTSILSPAVSRVLRYLSHTVYCLVFAKRIFHEGFYHYFELIFFVRCLGKKSISFLCLLAIAVLK